MTLIIFVERNNVFIQVCLFDSVQDYSESYEQIVITFLWRWSLAQVDFGSNPCL